MKSIKYILMGLIFAVSTVKAQKNVKLTINHKLGSETFAINKASKSNLQETFNANRVEYYMSEISLEHDNGMITELDSFWILVDVKGATTFDLGQFSVTDLEAIHFSIGVEPAFNHSDPSKWTTGHPLAPKSPSMHWGWAAGYRFFAMEGKCGGTLSNTYEFHSLGDKYFFPQRIPTTGTDDNGDLIINLNADYDRVIEDITMGFGLIEHGEFPLNIKTLENVRDYVFTSSEGNRNTLSTVGIENNERASDLRIYPNPSANGILSIEAKNSDLSNMTMIIYDQSGRIVSQKVLRNWTGLEIVTIEQPGYYVLSLSDETQTLLNRAIVVTQ